MPATTKERVLDAAAHLVAAQGWATTTMGRVAEQAGVSRQTVHTEVGTRSGLAEALVNREIEVFFRIVVRAFDAHPGDAVEGVRAAVSGVLAEGAGNAMLAAIVRADHPDARHHLLPLLSSRSGPLVEGAHALVSGRIAERAPDVPAGTVAVLADTVVRATLSHLVQPRSDGLTASATEVADGLAGIVAAVIA